ncbi:sacsin N-terminal ATP-binding-like domain-containing protein [Actinomadura miaoliensis]|uniref:sacsin N-terminal ATP-binding-like domain-containing protein n=1 Tax=Actinomadura miaoliensis TaxID=430685 RepID=UPI0031ECBD97
MTSTVNDDPFGTGEIRDRVLRAWAQSPARFREDANAEEDFALGGYRDRVVVELAQNAADAAVRAGVPGRLRLTLRGAVLTAANTGAPLDAAGVEALSTLRASAKRDDEGAAGRFGVGFSAVVAVSDRPAIVSARTGGVEWSAARARALAARTPALLEELERRGGHVPLLRLPFPLDEAVDVPDGFDTVVRLPLRDDEAAGRVREQLRQAGPALLLALPALTSVEIDVDGETRTLTAEHDEAAGTVVIDGTRWRTAEDHGVLRPDLLADRPTEERARPVWQVRWAVPDTGDLAGTPAVVHAPTPSDERLDLPALLIASFPLAPDRRHVAPGPLTDFLVERAADAYARLLRALPTSTRLLDLVPGPVAAGELDARIRRAVLDRLPEVPLLPAAGAERVRGRDAVAVDGPAAFVELLGGGDEPVVPGLLPPAWPVRHAALGALGVRRLDLADVIDELAALDREPAWWRGLYETLTGAPADALGALPVPLADGDRLVRGPRGLLVAADGVDPARLGALGLRFVHPDAVHPLLPRLGAVEAGPRAVLADPAVRAAVEGSFDADDPDEIAEAVLGLVRAAGIEPGEEPWLAELALPGADGDLYPAGELLLPDSPLRDLIAADAPFGVADAELVERWGAGVLAAAGVLEVFAVARAEDVEPAALADGDVSLHLDDEDRWADDVLARVGDQELPPLLPEFQAVRDLELVDGWDAALRLLAGRPALRAAVVEPAHVTLHDGRRVAVPSYTAWWLRRHPVLNGRRPTEFHFPGEDDLLAGLYDPAPAGLDRPFLLALGVRTSLADLLAEPGGAQELLDRMGDPARSVPRRRLGRLWTAVADNASALEPPERVRAVVDGEVEVVDAADALVLDRPDLLPLLRGQPLVIASHGDAAEHLAELLDLPLAGEEIEGVVRTDGEKRPVPAVVRAVLPDAPGTYIAHDRLVVDGVSVPWWCGDGQAHATGPWGLARALAWLSGRWEARLPAEAVLRDPGALPTLLAENDLES